jgi:hypothetical protein
MGGMCDQCLMEYTDGNVPAMTDDMWELAGQIFDWYHLHEINGAGGALHIVLDDMNIDDGYIDFCENWLRNEEPVIVELIEPGERVIEGLRALPLPERATVVHFADPYGARRPAAPVSS